MAAGRRRTGAAQVSSPRRARHVPAPLRGPGRTRRAQARHGETAARRRLRAQTARASTRLPGGAVAGRCRPAPSSNGQRSYRRADRRLPGLPGRRVPGRERQRRLDRRAVRHADAQHARPAGRRRASEAGCVADPGSRVCRTWSGRWQPMGVFTPGNGCGPAIGSSRPMPWTITPLTISWAARMLPGTWRARPWSSGSTADETEAGSAGTSPGRAGRASSTLHFLLTRAFQYGCLLRLAGSGGRRRWRAGTACTAGEPVRRGAGAPSRCVRLNGLEATILGAARSCHQEMYRDCTRAQFTTPMPAPNSPVSAAHLAW